MNDYDIKYKVANFKRLNFDKKGLDVSKLLENLYSQCKEHGYNSVQTITLSNGMKAYLSKIVEISDPKAGEHVYLLNISCVDTSQLIEYADLRKSVDDRTVIPDERIQKEGDIGALANTRLLIDPFTRVIVLSRGMYQLNQSCVIEVLKHMFGLNKSDDLSLDIILNEQGYKDISSLDVVNHFEVSVAAPKKLKYFHDLGMLSDKMRMFKYGKSSKINLSFETYISNTNMLVKDIKDLCSSFHKKNSRLKKMQLNGTDKNGNDKQVNLIHNKLKCRKPIYYLGYVKTKNYFDFLFRSYNSQVGFIKKIY